MRSPSWWAVRWMSSQVWASALRGQISRADLRVEDFGPAAGQAAQAGRHQLFEDRPAPAARLIWAKWSISTAVQAFRCRRGKAACRSRIMPRYQSNVFARMHAADDVQFGAAGVGRLLAAGEDLGRRSSRRPADRPSSQL